jgi:hypothetical protein
MTKTADMANEMARIRSAWRKVNLNHDHPLLHSTPAECRAAIQQAQACLVLAEIRATPDMTQEELCQAVSKDMSKDEIMAALDILWFSGKIGQDEIYARQENKLKKCLVWMLTYYERLGGSCGSS